eukprot:Platyproteum_vivax@DN7166_c0_g1_i1.p1
MNFSCIILALILGCVSTAEFKNNRLFLEPYDETNPLLYRLLATSRTEAQENFSNMDSLQVQNTNLWRALRGESVDHVPVWMMRQAGRYLPEFREIIQKHGFFKVCMTPSLAAEITLQPYWRFKVDAAIVFSDILTVPKAMGQPLQMIPGVGPVFDWRLESPQDLEKLSALPTDAMIEEHLGYVAAAIRETRKQMQDEIPMIGFCGAPWTLMGYMVEGKSSKTWSHAQEWLQKYPEASHTLLQMIADVSVKYLVSQRDAGAKVLQVFDTNAVTLSPADYEVFGAAYMNLIAKGVKAQRPDTFLIAFPKNRLTKSFGQPGAFDAVSLGPEVDRQKAREVLGPNITLQGNLDPQVLHSNEEAIVHAKTVEMIGEFGTKRYIANLGHGMEPGMTPEMAKAFVDAVHSYPVEEATENQP